MATYYLKPGPGIEADPYASGMEDGVISFTSATILTNPIPVNLQAVAVLWDTQTGDDWTISIPYVGDGLPIYPDDYIISPVDADKYPMRKAEFEAMYDTGFSA